MGNLERRLEIHFGAERRLAWREEEGGGEEVRHKEGEELKKTFWLATSKRRLCWQRKFAPRIGMETGAS